MLFTLPWGLLIPISQFFDEGAHFFGRRGIKFSGLSHANWILGEMLELAIPCLFILAIVKGHDHGGVRGVTQAKRRN